MKEQVKKKKVFVGVSGGVDSSVALALLKEQGYDVTGVFLKTWHPDFLPCDWKEERRSAMRVCATLDVPFMTLDCEEEYKKEVADYMIEEYKKGRTPNPDIFCNKYVKFGVFLKKALEMGADFVATGHYAQNFKSNSFSLLPSSLQRDSRLSSAQICQVNHLTEPCFGLAEAQKMNYFFQLLEAKDKNKDQSYFLYTLNQEQLSKILFPIGHLTKPEVRKLAEKFGLSTATKKDSQGVCFLGDVDMKEFLSHYIETKKGDVLNTEDEVIGFHNGAFLYTIGERHGFTITKKSPNDPRFFVVAKDLEKNTITVAGSQQLVARESAKEIFVKDLHLIQGMPLEFKGVPWKCEVRIRYRQEKQKCEVLKKENDFLIKFEKPQIGVAKGQSAVLYDGEVCIGGGIIQKIL